MKSIIMTGSTGGLGRTLGEILLDQPESVFIYLYRNKTKYEEIYKDFLHIIKGYELEKSGDFSDLAELLDKNQTESVVLILNACSIVPIKRVGDYKIDEIEEFVYGNLTRNLLLLNTVVKYCKQNSIGLRIIHLDSGAADFPLTGWANYCATKAYMNSFLSVVSAENPEFQIVSCDPGVMNTDMQAEIRAADKTVFDQVDTFIGYKKDNKLNDPRYVAKQIKERYICDWTTKNMREKIR